MSDFRLNDGQRKEIATLTLSVCLQFVALGTKRTREAQIHSWEHRSLGKDET